MLHTMEALHLSDCMNSYLQADAQWYAVSNLRNKLPAEQKRAIADYRYAQLQQAALRASADDLNAVSAISPTNTRVLLRALQDAATN